MLSHRKKRHYAKFLLVNPNSWYLKLIDYFYMILIVYSCFTVMFRSAFEDYTDLWIKIIDYIIEAIFLIEVLAKYVAYPFIKVLNRIDTFWTAVLSHLLNFKVWFDVIPLIFTVVNAATDIRLLLLLWMFRFYRFWNILDEIGDSVIKGLLNKIVKLVTRSRENQLIYVSFLFIFIWIFIISFKALVITYFVASIFWIISDNTRDTYPSNFIDNFGLNTLNPFE